MPYKIFIAKAPKEIDEVFKVRHRVFAKEEGLLADAGEERIFDRYDAYPNTTNLAVSEAGDVIGGMRVTVDSDIGIPADHYFDFRQYLPEGSRPMHCGMFCVEKAHRHHKVSLGLLYMASYFAISNNVTHIVAPINPMIGAMLMRIGFQKVADQFVDQSTGVPMVPLIADMANMNDAFTHFVQANQIQDFIHQYERVFFKDGEYVIKAGDTDNCAYVIIEGKAKVLSPKSGKEIGQLGQGDVFGELALLTNMPRSTSIIAQDGLQVMSLSQSVFSEQLIKRPERVKKLLEMMGARTHKLIQALE